MPFPQGASVWEGPPAFISLPSSSYICPNKTAFPFILPSAVAPAGPGGRAIMADAITAHTPSGHY